MHHVNTIHGHTPRSGITKTYQAWRGIINRCYRPKTKGYAYYGGRGISVAEEWRAKGTGFPRFLAHVGEPPSRLHSIDRIDNDGNYEPGNVRWATKEEQVSNKRDNRWLTGFGKTQLMEHWASEYSIDPATLYDRVVYRGMTIEDAVRHIPQTSKLTKDEVRSIRLAHTGGESMASLGRRHGVSLSNISHIIHRVSWKHI